MILGNGRYPFKAARDTNVRHAINPVFRDLGKRNAEVLEQAVLGSKFAKSVTFCQIRLRFLRKRVISGIRAPKHSLKSNQFSPFSVLYGSEQA